MNWNAMVEKLTPYIVKIETPGGHGTGFLCLYNGDKSFAAIATARHVVSHADEWQEPIRLRHLASKNVVFLKEAERIIFPDTETDSAVILMSVGHLDLPKEIIPLLPNSTLLPVGTEIGWLGFPAVAPWAQCFFSGTVSAREEWRHAYLIDGVAINGVSGGPVFHLADTDGVQIVGTISAYVSNRATGENLPGLAIATDVSHFHSMVSTLKSMDEAREKRKEQTQEQQVAQQTQPPATPLPSETTPSNPSTSN